MRKRALAAALLVAASSASAQISRMPGVPLRDQAPAAFARAERNLKSVYMEEGMAGIQDAVEKCYRGKRTVASVQYCFAMHYVGHVEDEGFAQSSIGQGRRVPYFTKARVYRTGIDALRGLGFTEAGATETIGVWLAASDYSSR
jgi:hypothetical protein